MKAWVVRSLGGIEALSLEAVPDPPAPGPGEATVRMVAVGLNFPDLLMLEGRYQYRPPLPFVPGMEGVGRVEAVGEGVSADLLGQRLLVGARAGLMAQRVTLPLSALRPAPDTLSDAEAAAFTVGALTAWVGLVERGRLAAGERLLVLGAGGGMGLMAVALGAALGAEVWAVASSLAKLALAEAAGAQATWRVDRQAPDLGPLAGQFDLVFDPVGGPLVAPAIAALRPGGRYLVIGFAGGPPVPLGVDQIQARFLEVIGVRAGEAGRRDPAAGRRHLAAIDRLAAEGRLRPAVGLTLPFVQAPEAFRAMARGELCGKAVIWCDTD
ncbi:MAG: zinc-binding dehydrogenase [Sphingomonadaceae bacterium]|uniref:zinc-binding dehydrogenase n=1 Tax=Thermaurantiacus sp. TaxID=2820283 RepID=UPI00298EE409|nr:zinc-binding dehydrogenase [Thermaurantiacus sp.]MCS6986582.1 zinc-binding dehydrogenase [Sphingomonadaceae bacterium]MDW8414157.1 zinc-binding dehydrogenase [Thermaurantiacus sp.]